MTPNLPKQPPEATAEDVMRAAHGVVGPLDVYVDRKVADIVVQRVARAITAERERCDAICGRFLTGLPSRDTSSTARGIQQLIRAGA